jgi:hypothetical protein
VGGVQFTVFSEEGDGWREKRLTLGVGVYIVFTWSAHYPSRSVQLAVFSFQARDAWSLVLL